MSHYVRGTTAVVATPGTFRGRLWCVVNDCIYLYFSSANMPGEWVKQTQFYVTGPNAAGFINGLFQQRATAFPVLAATGGEV